MFVSVLPFITSYLDDVDRALKAHAKGRGLTGSQRRWLSFCLMGVLLSNTVSWASFERCGLRGYRLSALSWMFRRTKLVWEVMFQASVGVVLERYGLGEGVLVVDDSDRRRAKRTRRIDRAHKIYDKKTGGYFNGQSMVFLLLVTDKVTLPVNVCFAYPDPAQQAWRKEEERLKKLKTPKAERPEQPAFDPAYPTKWHQALDLIRCFRSAHPQIRIRAVLADAWYANAAFMDQARALCQNTQVISQLRSNQKVRFRGKERSLTEMFTAYPGVTQRIRVRGGQEVEIVVSSARLYVCAHHQKRFVIAMRYSHETAYRFLVATDLSWRTLDIIQVFTLRWLVEVFLQDWKLYEGWAQQAKQPDEEGSSRSLILSLLLDHALILHPQQTARLKHPQSAYTVGSLRRYSQGEALVESFRGVLAADNPQAQFEKLAEIIKTVFPLAPSCKHMSGHDLGRQEPTPSLRYRAVEVCAWD